ncbi:MAG TPA: hypothetical protein VK986_05160, partial [Tepidisphaeraceae bacterium]|nr:hypothetical protein [Tepidisphaeraceae bacterium]
PRNPTFESAETFWHFAKIAKYDQAIAEGEKLLASNPAAPEMLAAFEAVARERGDDLFDTLLRWGGNEKLKDISQKLVGKLKEGQTGRITDRGFILEQVKRANVNSRGFENALNNLRQSGEIAAAVILSDVLRDENAANLHVTGRALLTRLGRLSLNPAVASLESKQSTFLIRVIGALGDMGYGDAAPYIARLHASTDPGTQPIKAAAAQALAQLGVLEPSSAKPAQMFHDLAERFYYSSSSITFDTRYPDANVWSWADDKGLIPKVVPNQIFNEIMSKRAAEYALKIEPGRADTVSLWLAANNRREADLPEGKTDTTHDGPDAHFYNVALGTQYCNNVLARALKDRTPAVALKIVKSLQEIAGQSNMLSTIKGGDEPIIRAMQFPERAVRYEAAIALGSALPQAPFAGQEMVVPTLAEAISISGKPNVVIVAADLNAANTMKEAVKEAARVETANDPDTATAAAGRLANVDVLIIDSRNNKDTDAVLGGPRVRNVARVIVVETKASPYVAEEFSNDLITTVVAGTAAPAADALNAAVAKARTKSGAAAMDDKLAEGYAQRAAALLERLAVSRGQILDIGAAQTTLTRALEDTRVEVAKSAAGVLATINNKDAQTALAIKAADEKTADDLKAPMFKALAKSAKFYGNLLDASVVEQVQKVVETHGNLAVRSAAGEAQGALNLSPERAKNLIIQQSPVGK